MDFETSPSAKCDSPESVADDNHSEKTGSEGSEGFVKVDQVIDEPTEQPSVEEVSHTRPIVETVPPLTTEEKNHLEAALYDRLNSTDDDATREKYLRDYYEQLPTETAPFSLSGYSVEGGADVSPGVAEGYAGSLISSFQDDSYSQMKQLSKEDIDLDRDTVNPLLLSEAHSNTEASGDSETTKNEGVNGDVTIDPIKPPTVEEVEPEELPSEVFHSKEPVVEKPPSAVASNESFHFISVGDSEKAGSKEKKAELTEVVDLVFWRDVRVSAFTFAFSLLVLLSLRCFSVVAVFAYLSLALLSVTISFRLYKFVLQTINGTQQPNPFQSLLDADVTLSEQQVQRYTEVILVHFNRIIVCARDLILVKSIAGSLKFGVLMWLLTYVGSWFNGLTILTIDLLFAFILPPVYEKYQTPIDTYYNLACTKVGDVYKMVKSKIPGGKQKTQ